MKFKIFTLLLFTFSCAPHLETLNLKNPYSAKGFAYIYNEKDFNEKIIKGKMNNEKLQISHQSLKTGSYLMISNPSNKKSIILKNTKRIRYPEFYKILITKSVAEKLNLRNELPLIEINEIKKNKSFVAKKAKIYNEEKKISSKAPVASVKISNISKDKVKKIKKKNDNIYIDLGTFYSIDTAEFLKKRIMKEYTEFNNSKIKIKKINNKENQVIVGPYISVNSLKNDYIKLKSFGFEELDIFLND